jgi:predicted HTH domain antitoxin
VAAAYLDGDISLGRAALLLGLSRFDLLARFNRLGLPAHLGLLSFQEATAEYDVLQGDAR